MSVLLPEPDTPVMHTSCPSGMVTSMSRKLFLPRASDGDGLSASRSALDGDGYLLESAQVLAGQRLRFGDDGVHRPGRHDVAAMFARAWAEVHDVVGGAHDRLVVFDYQHGVADVAQILQRAYQPVVVRRMQPDGRLVAHVQHAH